MRQYATPTLANTFFQVLIPTEKVVTMRNGKKVIKEKTFMPAMCL